MLLLNRIGLVRVAPTLAPVIVLVPEVRPPKVIRPELAPVVPRETPDAPVNAPLVPVTVLAQVKALLTVIALVIVPAVAGAVMVHVPEVDPQRVITPLRVPATPTC